MKVEVMFHSSSTPKVHEDAVAVYTKGALCCIELEDGMIVKYPLENIFSVCHRHGPHWGSTKDQGKDIAEDALRRLVNRGAFAHGQEDGLSSGGQVDVRDAFHRH